MKRIIYILTLSIFASTALVSCNDDDDEFFEMSAEARVQQQLQEYRDILTTAENGWHTTYIPFQSGPEVKLWFDFNANGRVTTWSDIPSGTYVNPLSKQGIFENDETNYRVGIHQKPDLVFEDLMVLSNIAIQRNGNFDGEYEFEFVSASKDSVVLQSSLETKTEDRTQLVLYPSTDENKEKVTESYNERKAQMDLFLELNPEYTEDTADTDYIAGKYIYAFVKNNVPFFMLPKFETHGVYIGTLSYNDNGYFVESLVYRSIYEFTEEEWILNVPYPYAVSNTINSEINGILINNLVALVAIGNTGYYEIL
ncbi:MAG: DUF4302 domain-containing protein [Aestuariibaculum sp.]